MNQGGLDALHQPPLTSNEGWDGDFWDTTRLLWLAEGGASWPRLTAAKPKMRIDGPWDHAAPQGRQTGAIFRFWANSWKKLLCQTTWSFGTGAAWGMHRAFSFPVTVERSRTKQHLEASLVGLCELELRKQRQECLVLGALALGDPPVQHNPGAEAACFRSWGQENLTLRRKLVRSCMFICNLLPACLSIWNPVKLITRDFWWPNQSVWRAWTVFFFSAPLLAAKVTELD